MAHQIDQIENHLESFFEGTLNRLVGLEMSPSDVAIKLSRAMSDGVRRNEEGGAFAPDKYAITFHPKDAEDLLKAAPDLQQALAKRLLEAARISGYMVFSEPIVTVAADPTLSRHEVRVIAWHSTSPLEFTQEMARDVNQDPAKLPTGAYLIVDGNRHFPLDRYTINIGRRLDNQLILDDPRVSRTHAQIRVRESRFVLFDVGSAAGVHVNGRSVNQHLLQPGDVIDIAGIRLVYGEDPGGPPDETPAYSPPFPPKPAGDQRTRTIHKKTESEK